MEPETTPSLWRLPRVSLETGCARSTIYDALRVGKFPRPVRLGARTVAWSSAEVRAWIAAKLAERDAQGGVR